MPEFEVGQRLIVQGKHPATVVGDGWTKGGGTDPFYVWVTFGQAEVPSKILRSLCEAAPDDA